MHKRKAWRGLHKSLVASVHLCVVLVFPVCLVTAGILRETLPRPIIQPEGQTAWQLAPPYQFPDGGRQLFPKYRLVALYGMPNEPILGALGQQSLTQTVTRVKSLAVRYQPYTTQHVLPTLEIIASVASASPTVSGDYSQELTDAELQPWITAARKAGVYVVLDLQPGRASFLAQAKNFASLLEQPNVGLALDPEWRLTSNQVPLVQIGSVNIAEINATDQWLSTLTAQNKLPQKLLVLQQFRMSMIIGRQDLNTRYSNLAFIIQMDGQGPQSVKLNTWQAITTGPPVNVRFGWKNFYQKDTPVRSPAATMQLNPTPWYVSYE